MPVALLPPTTSGGTFGTPDADVHTEGPRYVRGRDSSRWHRVRSSFTHRGQDWTVYRLWCGQHVHVGGPKPATALTADEISDGLPACGPCVGKALGAGQDDVPVGMPALRFDPRWCNPPPVCPGSQSRMYEEINYRVGRCLACGELTPLRAYGGGAYYSCLGVGPAKHAPGPDLVDPCPWHAWNHLRLLKAGRVGCGCDWKPAQVTR